jgi:DNA-binding SARP family transcriptional activator
LRLNPMDGNNVRFGVLGRLVVWRGPREVALPSGVLQRLLAVLLTAEDPIPAKTLLELAWLGNTPPSGRTAMQVGVSRLRRWLSTVAGGSVAVVCEHGNYRLIRPLGSLDAEAFERQLQRCASLRAPSHRLVDELLRALTIWRGPALDGNPIAAHLPAVRRWELQRTAAGNSLVEAALNSGRATEALPWLLRLADEHPMHEALHAGLARLLAVTGQQAAALSVLQAIRSRLAEELGLDPSPVLTSALEGVLRQSVRR